MNFLTTQGIDTIVTQTVSPNAPPALSVMRVRTDEVCVGISRIWKADNTGRFPYEGSLCLLIPSISPE